MISGRIPLAALALIALAGCVSESPEARVRKAFERCVQNLEKGDGAAALEAMSPDFQGPEGMDRHAARLYLLAILKRERLGITVLKSRIKAQEQSATQELSVIVTERDGPSVLPDGSSRQDFLIQWERRKGEWRARSMQRVR